MPYPLVAYQRKAGHKRKNGKMVYKGAVKLFNWQADWLLEWWAELGHDQVQGKKSKALNMKNGLDSYYMLSYMDG